MGSSGVRELPTWVIYDHPKDFPEYFVARKWMIREGGPEPTEIMFKDTNLERMRSSLPDGLIRIPRYDGDDPAIIESWI